MMEEPMVAQNLMHGRTRLFLATTVVIIVVVLLAATLTLPFLFESQSMFYKFGWKKTVLRIGKMVGLTAALLVLLQLPLAARLKWLDRIYSLPLLYTAHRFSAWTILLLVIIHPVLVFFPDGTLMIPFETRYWPEWVGAAVGVSICLQFGLGRWRRTFFKSYQKWLLLHRTMGAVVMVLLIVHILYVSETFEHDGLPRNLVMAAAAVILALWLWVRVRSVFARDNTYRLRNIEAAGEYAYAIDMVSATNSPLRYLPGQFAFFSFDAPHLSKEPHPFTLSSSPSRADSIQVTIRECGDWTRQIHTLQEGAKVSIQGPFGRFGHLFLPPGREIIMIAGGIGITPMLSMLRHMRDSGDPRRTTLIWSNQTPAHLFNAREVDELADHLTDFRWIPIFTREKGKKGQFGRLDQNKLEFLLKSCRRDAAVFLCGPPPMIKQVRQDLQKIGFAKRSFHFEAFGF